MVLLTIAALALSAATRAVATLTDDATLVARAQLQSGAAAERGLLQTCDTATTRTFVDGVRVHTELLDAGTARLQTRIVSTVMQHSPFTHRSAARDSQRLALSTARTCP